VSVPRCASTSIESAILNSPITINHYRYGASTKYPQHVHIELPKLYEKFGKIETIVVKRNYFDRWISALQQTWYTHEINDIQLLVKWEDMNNDFIYEIFTKDYVDSIYLSFGTENQLLKHKEIVEMREFNNSIIYKFAKNIPKSIDYTYNPLLMLLSQSYWVDNNKCTYEFDIDEIDKFEKFMCNRYEIDFKVDRINKSNPIKNNIVKDDKLKKWVFDNFEKRFEPRNQLI
jgi:hypothetical protein